jgi:hypothetical protein
MATQYVMQRDTSPWRIQVWTAFGISAFACLYGAMGLPGGELDRAFLGIGFLFSVFASFAVAKTVRDNRDGQVDTAGWVIAVWVALACALGLTAWGLFRMTLDPWLKRYMVISWLFLVSTTFTLAKTLRDGHEADLLEGRNAGKRLPPSEPQ